MASQSPAGTRPTRARNDRLNEGKASARSPPVAIAADQAERLVRGPAVAPSSRTSGGEAHLPALLGRAVDRVDDAHHLEHLAGRGRAGLALAHAVGEVLDLGLDRLLVDVPR